MEQISHLCCQPDNSLYEVYTIFDQASSHDLPSGIALVIDQERRLIGTVTDGDIRRAVLANNSWDIKVDSLMQKDPIYFPEDWSISEILDQIPKELEKRNRRSTRYLSKIVLIDKEGRPSRVLDYHHLWEQKVASHRHVVVVGLGYVGLTMAVVMADAGFLITGVELDENKIQTLKQGKSYVHELGLEELIAEQIGKNFKVSNEIPDDGDVFIISVGTPVVKDDTGRKRPIMNFLEDACEKIGQKLRRGHLVILRSTVPIGTCRRYVKTKLEEISGLKCGIDFHLSFAPERTAEGKALKELRSLPQIIGGFNADSLEATAAIFRDLTPTIVRVDSLESAEMAKLINNSYRDYVFAYSNQMAQIASRFNINVVDVIRAANEGYPRDPVPLPSPGVGGPCLTKDPHIFAAVAEEFNFDGNIFIRGREINESMHLHVFNAVASELSHLGKKLEACKVVVCGLAFKGNPETGDIRNSSGIEIAELFLNKTRLLGGYDPVALAHEISEYGIKPMNLTEAFENTDIVLFLNNHKSFEKINVFEMVRAMADRPIIYDAWNLFRGDDVVSAKPSIYMGLSHRKDSLV